MKTILFLLTCFILAGSPLLAAQASGGKEVFQEMCSRCHKLPENKKWTAKQWVLLVDLMQGIMAQKGVALLDEKEKSQVLIFLQENARHSSSGQETGAQDMFAIRCALCHQLPEPDMLKLVQWKLILKTMQLRMQKAGIPPLNAQESEQILDYLAQHARK